MAMSEWKECKQKMQTVSALLSQSSIQHSIPIFKKCNKALHFRNVVRSTVSKMEMVQKEETTNYTNIYELNIYHEPHEPTRTRGILSSNYTNKHEYRIEISHGGHGGTKNTEKIL